MVEDFLDDRCLIWDVVDFEGWECMTDNLGSGCRGRKFVLFARVIGMKFLKRALFDFRS